MSGMSLVVFKTGMQWFFVAGIFVTSFVLWLIIKAVIGIRVSKEEDQEDDAAAECGQVAFPEFTKE